MKKLFITFLKGFISSPHLMFKNNKLSRANRDILEKDLMKIQKDKNNINSKSYEK